MPKLIKYSKRNRRRSKRRFRKSASKLKILTIKGVSIIPDKLFCKLKYNTDIVMVSTGVNRHIFHGNSLFDPDVTGGGHQPRGFDEWSSLYTRYKVHKSVIVVKAINTGTAVNTFSIVPSTGNNLLNVYLTHNDYFEAPYSKHSYLTPLTGDDSSKLLVSSMMTKTIRGERVLDDDYSALTSTNPSKLWFWQIAGSTSDDTSAPSLNLSISIIYSCEFFRRKALVQS